MTDTSFGPGSYRWKTATPEEYVRRDEELLRNGEPAARVEVLASGALSVGVSQRDDAACVVRARRRGIPIVRRSTGGLALWHAPGDIAWSLVLPRSDPRVGNDFSKAYGRLGAGVVQLLRDFGISAAWTAPAGPVTEYCLLSGRGDVLTVEGRAVGGAAQHLTRKALLHHGVLSYRLDPSRLRELFDLSPVLVERSLTCLELVAGGVAPEEWARRLEDILVSPADPRRR